MMSDAPAPTEQFWLLTGEVPAGPFTVAQVHAELAAGRATWQTPACPVGGSNWLPLVQTPGIGPAVKVPEGEANAAPPPAVAAPSGATVATTVVAGPSPEAPPAPVPAVPSAGESRLALAVGVGMLLVAVALVGAAAYGVYEWVRPLTATEVCERADKAKTAAEAKRYATPRMHPLIDAMFAGKTGSDPNDTSEWTGEVDGPRPDTKLVGMRGTTFVPEAGRRVRVEGHVVMVRSDGWKADDMVITGVEGAPLSGPVSLVDEQRRAASPSAPPGLKPGEWPLKKSDIPPGLLKPAPKPWYDWIDPRKNKLVLYGLVLAAASAIGAAWKWLTGSGEKNQTRPT